MPGPTVELIYKIITDDLWSASLQAGELLPMPIDQKDGYLHFSTSQQLRDTLRLHFAGRSGLMLLEVSTGAVSGLRWETSRGGQLFPHVYGQLPLSDVTRAEKIAVQADGTADLPWGL